VGVKGQPPLFQKGARAQRPQPPRCFLTLSPPPLSLPSRSSNLATYARVHGASFSVEPATPPGGMTPVAPRAAPGPPRRPAAPHRLAAAAAAARALGGGGGGGGGGAGEGLGPTPPVTPLGEAADTVGPLPATPLSRARTTPARWAMGGHGGGGCGGGGAFFGRGPTTVPAKAPLPATTDPKSPLLVGGAGTTSSPSSSLTSPARPARAHPSLSRRASSALASALAPVAARARSALEVWRDAGERDGMAAHGGAGSVAAAYAAAAAPPSLHGAPASAAAGREVLERLGRMGRFEGQDFDATECDVERVTALHRGAADYAREEAWRWVLACECARVVVCMIERWGAGGGALSHAPLSSTYPFSLPATLILSSRHRHLHGRPLLWRGCRPGKHQYLEIRDTAQGRGHLPGRPGRRPRRGRVRLWLLCGARLHLPGPGGHLGGVGRVWVALGGRVWYSGG